MTRKVALSLIGLAGAALATTLPAVAEGYTTRIETRPFYGAVVTLEEGVRVFRPLPPERQVIINPNGQTPLSLGFNETNVYEHRSVENYNYSDGAAANRTYGARVYGYGGNGRGHFRSHNGVGGQINGTPAGPSGR